MGLTEQEQRHIREEAERYARFDRIVFLLSSSAITANTGPGTFGLIFRIKNAREEAGLFDFLKELA